MLCSREEWEAVAPVVRAVAGQLDRLADRGMWPHLTAVTRLAVWAHREGLPMVVEMLLSHSILEAHAATLDGSVGTFRSQLRRLAAANGVPVETTGRGFDRPEYSRPYSEVCTQVGGHLALRNALKSGGLTRRGFWDAFRSEFQ